MTTPARRLWIATQNPKKKAELLRLLEPMGLELRTLADLDRSPDGRPAVDWTEDAPDFAGNARIKAFALAATFTDDRDLALGDDSGLAVDALDGRPGVHSARWAGPEATDDDRTARLLGELQGVEDARRSARFVCHLCLAGRDPKTGEPRVLWTTERNCEGEILHQPRGGSGFGYDPVFLPREGPVDPDPRSFAELTPGEKDAISHRGRALRDLASHLRATLSGEPSGPS